MTKTHKKNKKQKTTCFLLGGMLKKLMSPISSYIGLPNKACSMLR